MSTTDALAALRAAAQGAKDPGTLLDLAHEIEVVLHIIRIKLTHGRPQ